MMTRTATQLVHELYYFGVQGRSPNSSTSTSTSTTPAAVDRVTDVKQLETDCEHEEEEDVFVSASTSGGHAAVLKQQSPKGKEKMEHLTSQATHMTITNESPSGGVTKTKSQLQKLLRSTDHTVETTSITPSGESKVETKVITSWKMADYAYKREPCPFPTRARGLFTERVNSKNEKGEEDEQFRIVVRGYDKFFNINEVSWTQWDTIASHSSPPYELTHKANGCIIFISTLTPTHLLVTSKHAIGPPSQSGPSYNFNIGGLKQESNPLEKPLSHSQKGEYWLERHLRKVGKTKEELASVLWNNNWTAVAELCDDSFEEHVLPYSKELTGLHLHGLNNNSPTLNTLPSSFVTQFGKEWGFIPTPFVTFTSVQAVKTYCETVESVGGVEEEDSMGKIKIVPVEGFVIRGKKKGALQKGESFFWKVKYDQPYLMYREWRELTRKMLSSYYQAKEAGNLSSFTGQINFKGVKNRESRLYLWWVCREMDHDLDQFESWSNGKGIIATREKFLAWRKENYEEAKKVAKEIGAELGTADRSRGGFATGEDISPNAGRETNRSKKFNQTLIVPIAIQGCGKTALGLELAYLYGFGHVQSDDFIMKKSGPHFIKAVKASLEHHSTVFADKNNHTRMLRANLVQAAQALHPQSVRLVAFVWSIDSPSLPRDALHKLCATRIQKRGQNHQTLRAGEGHEIAIWQFLGQYEAFDASGVGEGNRDGCFDEMIEMDPSWGREEALRKAVKTLQVMGVLDESKGTLTEEQVKAAVQYADDYRPSVKQELSASAVEKIKEKLRPRYYGLAIQHDLKALLDPFFFHTSSSSQTPEVYLELTQKQRFITTPHVTLVHEKSLISDDEAIRSSQEKLWDRYEHLTGWDEEKKQASEGVSRGQDTLTIKAVAELAAPRAELEVDITLGPRVFYNSRVISIEVSELQSASIPELRDFKGGHVTVGTINESIRPFEGKAILESALKGEKDSGEGGEIFILEMDEVVKCKGTLAGLR